MSQDIDQVLETKSEESDSDTIDSKRPAMESDESDGGFGYVILAFSFIALAVVFVGAGFDTMLTYESGYESADKIVGGDAYNYIIRANRGIGYICAGIASSVISATFGALSVRARISSYR